MKKIILLVASILTISCSAQTPVYVYGYGEIPSVIPQNAYIKDTNNILNKFAGTWVYSQNGQNFTVILQKIEMRHLINYYCDDLFGQYMYTVNNNTIVNTTNMIGELSRIKSVKSRTNENKIKIFFYDPERPKMVCEVELTYTNDTGVEKLNWRLYQTGANYSMENEPPAQFDFRVPTNCVLIKQ